MSAIYNPDGMVAAVPDNGGRRVVLITGEGAAAKGLGAAIVASDMQVTERTDIEAFRALSGKAYLMSYGAAPVSIEITGVELCSLCGKQEGGNGGGKGGRSVLSLFAEASVSSTSYAGFNVTVTGNGSATTYRCALVSLVTGIESNNMITYRISFIGVRK